MIPTSYKQPVCLTFVSALFETPARIFLGIEVRWSRGSAGFRVEIARWLKSIGYQSRTGGLAFKWSINSMSPLVLFFRYGVLAIIFGNGKSFFLSFFRVNLSLLF